MKLTQLRRVYVWELPVRFFHWINALAIVVLCITGYFIGNPPALMSAEEASFLYWFGIIRYIHFIAGYVFLFAIMMRLYWAIVGNKYANWRNFLPTKWSFFMKVIRVLKIDIFLLKGEERVDIGHNALASFSYFVFFLLTLFMIFTGFGLYAETSTWWLPRLFIWVPSVFGGDYWVREMHHVMMWVFIVFIIIHLYLVLYHDQFEGRGETSSMISGYKFIEEKVFEEAKEENKEENKPEPISEDV